jgi:hypothetical protein
MFDEIASPLIPLLSIDFDIVLMLVDFFIPPHVYNRLQVWEKDETIICSYIIPDYESVYRQYAFLKKNKEELRSFEFDICLMCQDVEIVERYVAECVLLPSCKTVCLSNMITYLFEREALVREMLGEQEESDGRVHTLEMSNQAFMARLLSKSPIQLYRALVRRLIVKKKRVNRKMQNVYDWIILPWWMERKTFYQNDIDQLTHLSSGRSDVIIFVDAREVKAHKILYPDTVIYEAQYPTQGSCRCSGIVSTKGLVLSPLSGFVGRDEIEEEYLSLFYRDFEIVRKHTGAQAFHLRLHPRETGDWPYQLQNYLTERGMAVEVVPCDKPFHEITCDYMGVAGFTSNALRDAEACCDHAFIIGFVGISQTRYSNPKFVYGEAKGIRWIEADGSFDRDIFDSRDRSIVVSEVRDVPSILRELSKGNASVGLL